MFTAVHKQRREPHMRKMNKVVQIANRKGCGQEKDREKVPRKTERKRDMEEGSHLFVRCSTYFKI